MRERNNAAIKMKEASTMLKRRRVKPSPIRKFRKLKRNVLPPQTKRRLDGVPCAAGGFCSFGVVDVSLTELAGNASEDLATSTRVCEFVESVDLCTISPPGLSIIYLISVIGPLDTFLELNELSTHYYTHEKSQGVRWICTHRSEVPFCTTTGNIL